MARQIPLHQPERDPSESATQYWERRKRSNAAAKRLRIAGEQRTPLRLNAQGIAEAGDPRGYWHGQHNATRAKRARRAAVRSLGIRQFKLRTRAAKLAAPASA